MTDQSIIPKISRANDFYRLKLIKEYGDFDEIRIQKIFCFPDCFLEVGQSFSKVWGFDQEKPYCLFDIGPNAPEIVSSALISRSQFLIGDLFGKVRIFDINSGSFVAAIDSRHFISSQKSSSISGLAYNNNNIAIRTTNNLLVFDVRRLGSPIISHEVNNIATASHSFDRFDVSITPSNKIITGSYARKYIIYDIKSSTITHERATKRQRDLFQSEADKVEIIQADPTGNLMAIASTSALYLYQMP